MAPSASSTSHLVLVADDEPSMLELIASHLKNHASPKLDVLEASDGEEAWQLARERLPDLVVLDVMMPGMSGWEVCRKIREDVALAHTSVVMLTGIGENLNQMTSPLYGADAYLDKPFDFDELDAKVKQALLARSALRASVARPATPVNGVAGPAKVAPVARKAPKKAAPAPPKKAAAKKAAPKKVAPKKAAAPKPKVVAKKKAPVKKPAPKQKAVVKKAARGIAKPKAKAAKLASAKRAPAKKATPKKKAKKK